MGQHHHDSAMPGGHGPQPSTDTDDDCFGGEGPLDPGVADGPLALTPPASAASDDSPYSWQCPASAGTPDAASAHPEVPGTMDFPQKGDGRCACGEYLIYQPRTQRG